MMAGFNNDPAVAEEVAGIKHSLHSLLTVATDPSLIRRFLPPRKEEGLRGITFRAAMRLLEASDAARKTAELIRDPLGESVRLSVRTLGKRLYELGGMDLMIKVLDEVADLDEPNLSRRETIMDRRWDGIGGWAS